MQKKITETTAAFGLGRSNQARLFQVPSGMYAGRRVALIQASPTEIVLAWSDAPTTGWSSPTAVASDAADSCFDAVMAPNGDLHLIYGEQATDYLVARKLTLTGGVWSVGAKVTIYSGARCYDPSIAIEPGGRIWVSYSRYVMPNRWIHVKSSDDSGATWGGGASDAGTQMSSGSLFAWSKMIVDPTLVRLVYHDQDTALYVRSLPAGGGSWSNAVTVASGPNLSVFDAGVGADGRLGVAWCSDVLHYREYDGVSWSTVANVTDHPVTSPQVLFEGNVAAVVYLDDLGSDMRYACFSDRRTGSFGETRRLDGRSGPFDSVVLYHAGTAAYRDLTAQAISYVAGDVFHPASGCLLKDPGDALYLGMEARFREARVYLSQVGSGGTLQVSYWDGVNWESFTPAGGNPALDAPGSDLLLWTDVQAVPDDWQKRLIDSQRRFWIRVEVISGFASGPVASQICAACDVAPMIFRR